MGFKNYNTWYILFKSFEFFKNNETEKIIKKEFSSNRSKTEYGNLKLREYAKLILISLNDKINSEISISA